MQGHTGVTQVTQPLWAAQNSSHWVPGEGAQGSGCRRPFSQCSRGICEVGHSCRHAIRGEQDKDDSDFKEPTS